jgi:hypothetical protein
MTSRSETPPIRIDVHPDDSLPDILDQVREHAGKSVVLAIPDHCPVLLTATEFRTLKEGADRSKVRLALDSDDRLRSQLSSMFGIRNVAADGAKRPNEDWRPPPTVLGSPRAFGTWKQRGEDDDDDEKVQEEETEDDSLRARRRRRSAHASPPPVPIRDGQEPEPRNGSLEYLNDDGEGWMTARNIGRLVAVVLVLGLILIAMGWYYMPGVTVNATLAQQPVTSRVLYSVAAPRATLPSDIEFTAEATQESATVPFTITIPTTGVDRTPDETATGSVLLRNPGEAAVTVPAGTQLAVFAGPTYTTNADIEVPAASDGNPGEATVEVTATAPGASGNVDGGMLTGRLPDLGVFYSNRDAAIEGGTDIEVKVVSAEDIQTLEQRIETDLQRAAASGWNTQLPEGQSVVTPSVQTGTPTWDIAAEPGQEADEISATGTVESTGLVYDQGVVDEQTRDFFETSLQEEVPEGYELDPDSIVLSEPESIAEAPDNVQYMVEASAVSHAVFGNGDRQALAEDLAGSTWSGARGDLGNMPQFATWEMSTNPGWWPDRIPQASDRIEINVERQPVPDATPDPTPEAAT